MNKITKNISNDIPIKVQNCILMNIKSLYIIDNIFEYTEDRNFKHKLFNYSKYFQKKLNIQLSEYKYKSNAYIFQSLDKFYICKETEKEIKAKKFEDYLNYFNLTKEDLYNYIKNITYKKIYSFRDFIDIYSPLFEFLSKKRNFEFFIIHLEKESKDNYINAFNELNKIKTNYSIILYIENNDYINYYFTKLNIKLNKLKSIYIINKYCNDNNLLFKSFFSFSDLKTTLICLKIELQWTNKIDSNVINNLNNFKLLSILHLDNISCENVFILKINSLKQLKLFSCENIAIDNDTCLNVVYLSISNTQLLKLNSFLKFPNVEYYESLSFDDIDNTSIIDFSSFKKINKFHGDINEFIYLDSKNLLDLLLQIKESFDFEIQKIAIGKISLINNLKHLCINYLNWNGQIDYLLNIKIKMHSLTIITLYGIECKNNLIFKLQEIFPNLTRVNITICNDDSRKYLDESSNLEIKESPSSKINSINIPILGNYSDKIYIQSYENLKDLSFDIKYKIKNLKNFFPIFNDECNINFKSLKSLSITFNSNIEMDLNIVNNIIHHLDKLPNLKDIYLKGDSQEINKDYYFELIKCILSRKIICIKVIITINYFSNNKYSERELKQIYTDFNPLNYYLVIINKLYYID